jgi:hypothetical protein
MNVEQEKNVDEIKYILNQISDRIPWGGCKPLLKKIGIHTSNGWPATIKNQDIYDAESQKQKDLIDKLKSLYFEHRLIGEKLVYWFSLSGIPTSVEENFHKTIIKAKNTVKIEKSQFSEIHPFSIVDKQILEQEENAEPVLTSIDEVNGKIYFQYSSVVSYKQKVDLSPEAFSAEDQVKLQRYDEIFGMLAIRKQSHDIVVYDPSTKMIEVRIDAPLGISFDDLSIQTSNTYNVFNRTSTQHFGYAPLGDNSLNLYSAIKKIYKNANEGKVHELGFMANTASSSSNNQGKLFKGKNRDLRKDDFHKGGSDAVTEIQPYRIGVNWSGSDLLGLPELTLPGNMRMLLKTPTVGKAYIRNCLSFHDYDFVTRRLLNYVLAK